jgi:hypothetical protein
MYSRKVLFDLVTLFRLMIAASVLWMIIQVRNGFTEDDRTKNLLFEIRDVESGELIPGKLVFLQEGSPVDLEIKSNGLIASRGNTIYTGNGRGLVYVPPGVYEVWAGRGTEYSADVHTIQIARGDTFSLVAKIRREVETPGYVSGDMHLHTLTFSGHGDAEVDERILSCIGEGLEWAVATDHNHSTDYAPYAKEMGVSTQLVTTVGNEVSTPIGHFNVYPVPAGAEFDDTLTDAQRLFRLIRSTNRDAVIQINHPRQKDRDYFTTKGLDIDSASTGDATWSWDFDAIEILNENRGFGWKAEAGNPVSVRNDWFNMLNNDRKFTAVGNSDSHHLTELLAGVPRNYIAVSTDDPTQFDEAELIRSIKEHNVSVSRGLYIELTANDGSPIGSEIPALGSEVALNIRVQAPGWVSCDSVKVIENGSVIASFFVPPSEDPVRFEQTVNITPPSRDSWYVVVATGSKSMAPLVHDAPPKEGTDEETVPILPLAFTNPIWITADGEPALTSLH